MPQMTIQQAMALALQHCRAGQLPQAEAIFRQVLQVQPQLPDAWANLALVLQQTGRIEESVLCHQRALRLNPRSVQLLNNLAGALRAAGRLPEAEEYYRQAAAAEPSFADTYVNLGALLRQEGRLDEAIAAYAQALNLRPDYAAVHFNLGNALSARGRAEEAIAAYRRAASLQPQLAEAQAQLGSLLLSKDAAEAAECSRRALALRPDDADTHYNLALAQVQLGQTYQAVESYRRAIALKSNFGEAVGNLANLLLEQGRPEEAIAEYRRAVALRPGSQRMHDNLLYALLLDPRTDDQALRQEYGRWEQAHARPLYGHIRPHANDRTPGRRLRIGYVSADFRQHVVGWLIEALLAGHDHESFEITCYSDAKADAVTQRLKKHVDNWHDTSALSDEQLADRVRGDGIDILVDLGVHLVGNRLLAFARKPAPIQATYLGCPATTGLATMDYRLTDRFLDPPGREQADGPEKLAYLPECYYCYTAPAVAPEVSDSPARAAAGLARVATGSRVRFASFNNSAKLNGQVLATWARLLKEVPDSELLVLVPGGERNTHLWDAFQRQDIPPQRIRLLERRDTIQEYFTLYHEVDIALDPFPYTGHTTTLDSLWMGVPVVSLAGQRAVGRAGVSILSNLGLADLVAQTPEDYVRIGAALAADLPRLTELRRTLRQRLRGSCLMDGLRFARGVERAYREMWLTCLSRPASAPASSS